uniref:RNA-binding S4 domain-containing protein n=2 Tax=Solanum TaxID=4107 RepID=A0A494G916_SOLLC
MDKKNESLSTRCLKRVIKQKDKWEIQLKRERDIKKNPFRELRLPSWGVQPLDCKEGGKPKPTPKKLLDRSSTLYICPPAAEAETELPLIRDVAKKTDSTRYALPALRFKTCRLLSGNVWNRELTIIQRRILGRLRNKKRSIKRKIYSRENLNSYIQSQTTRKLSLFYGDLPITEMHRGRERTSYIPFLLNPETRSDVIPVRLHFCETIPQARQPISHRRVCVNNGMVNITHFKLSHGDIISFQENDARTRGEEIKRSFYIEISVEKIIGKFLDHPWRRTKTEWFRLLKTKRGCRLLLKSRFLQQLRSSMQEEDLERTKKFGSEKVCLGSSFAEHNRMKRNFYHFKSLFLSKRRNEKNRNIPTRTRSPIVYNSSLYSNSTYCSAPPHQFTKKIKIKRIELPTHYSEVNHRTPKAVVSYGPNIGHIPHDIRLKDPNLLLRSGKGRGQNI